MNTQDSELTIVIPARNERQLLPRLLDSLCRQDYPQMRNTKVYVADAGSTDGTAEVPQSYSTWLDIEVIKGGLPSVGRNAGAWVAETPYVLFIDAGMELQDTSLISRSLELIQR